MKWGLFCPCCKLVCFSTLHASKATWWREKAVGAKSGIHWFWMMIYYIFLACQYSSPLPNFRPKTFKGQIFNNSLHWISYSSLFERRTPCIAGDICLILPVIKSEIDCFWLDHGCFFVRGLFLGLVLGLLKIPTFF